MSVPHDAREGRETFPMGNRGNGFAMFERGAKAAGDFLYLTDLREFGGINRKTVDGIYLAPRRFKWI
jgi:hypothetical protein